MSTHWTPRPVCPDCREVVAVNGACACEVD